MMENAETDELKVLQEKLQDLKEQDGIIGYILRGSKTAAIDLKDSEKIIEYATLSSNIFEASEQLAKTLQLGELDDLVVESETAKVLSLVIDDQKISIFMEKDFDHKKLCKTLK